MDVEILTWAGLAARAGSEKRARTLLRHESYRRVLRDCYVEAQQPDSPELRCLALAAVLPSGVALAGRTALWALGLDVLPGSGRLDVVTERGKHLKPRPGMRPRAAALPDCELVDLPNGLLAVSAARAFVDVGRREDLVEAVALGDAVLRSGAATVEQLQDAVDRAAKLKGVVAAREVLPHLEPRSESPGESRLRMRLVLGGLPRPQAQLDLYDSSGLHLGRVDAVLGGVLLEYDGRKGRDLGRDNRRQNRLVELGGVVRRYSDDDVQPWSAATLCAEVRRALADAPQLSPELHLGRDTLRPPRSAPLPTRAERAKGAEEAA